jgi:hypothetical protein
MAQGLVARWRTLVGEFTGGSAEIQKGLNTMYAGMPNWPAEQRQYQIRSEIQAFIVQAMKSSQTS